MFEKAVITLEEFLEKIVDPDYWTDLVDDDE